MVLKKSGVVGRALLTARLDKHINNNGVKMKKRGILISFWIIILFAGVVSIFWAASLAMLLGPLCHAGASSWRCEQPLIYLGLGVFLIVFSFIKIIFLIRSSQPIFQDCSVTHKRSQSGST